MTTPKPTFPQLLWRALERWADHNAPTRSAAIAFYSLTSLAPVSVLAVWLGGAAWGRETARARIGDALRDTIGPDAARLIASVMADASGPGGEALIPTVLAVLLFAFSATAVFAQLQAALREIWEAPEGPKRVVGFLRRRLVALALLGLLGVALIGSLGISIAASAITRSLEPVVPTRIVGVADVATSTVTLMILFTLVLKILPATRVPWREAAAGGLVTGVLHLIGQWLVGLYLGRPAIASAYGAAASLVVFLTWIYYSSMVFLFGAEVTRTLMMSREGAVALTASDDDARTTS